MMKTSTNARQQSSKHIPQRTCLACRRVGDKRELVRIVKTTDGVVVDETGKKAGRGTYLCRNKDCWEQGLKGNHLEYVLRTKLSEEDRLKLVEYATKL